MDIFHTGADFTTTLTKALEEIEPGFQALPGLIVAGTHAPTMIADKLDRIQMAREANMPTLGICFGLHLMLIEFARSVVGLKGANSQEIDNETRHPVVTKMPELRVGIKDVDGRPESHWHNYAFNNKYEGHFHDYGWVFGKSVDNILEVARYSEHPYFVGLQFHPEYQSGKDKPHPTLQAFIEACKRTAESHQA